MSKLQVGLYIVALAPFVPRLHENDAVLFVLVFHQVDGLLQMLPEVFGCRINVYALASAGTWRAVPVGHDGGEDVAPLVFGREEVPHNVGIVVGKRWQEAECLMQLGSDDSSYSPTFYHLSP